MKTRKMVPSGLFKQCIRFYNVIFRDNDWSNCFTGPPIQLVNWCFEPSQPLGIISGLKETFIKRYKVERTNKAEIRPEEQSEKTRESSGEFMKWNTVERAIKTEIDTRTEENGVGKLGWFMLVINRNIPTTWRSGNSKLNLFTLLCQPKPHFQKEGGTSAKLFSQRMVSQLVNRCFEPR